MGDPRTLVHRIGAHAVRTPRAAAVWGRVGSEWRRLSWALYWSSLRQAAKGLVQRGMPIGAVVGTVGGNRPEWPIAQYGILAAAGVAAPLDPSAPDDALAQRIRELQTRIIVCDTVERLVRIDRLDDTYGLGLDQLVVLDAVTVHDPRMITFDDLMMDGAAVRDDTVDLRLDALGADDRAIILEVDGRPLRLTHAELIARAEPLRAEITAGCRAVSELPPHLLAEQLVAMVLPLLVGCPVWFTGDGSVPDVLVEARPTLLLGSDRSWRDLARIVEQRLEVERGMRRRIVHWAASTERIGQLEGTDGVRRRLARRLVVDDLRKELGIEALGTALAIEELDPEVRDALARVGLEVRAVPTRVP